MDENKREVIKQMLVDEPDVQYFEAVRNPGLLQLEIREPDIHNQGLEPTRNTPRYLCQVPGRAAQAVVMHYKKSKIMADDNHSLHNETFPNPFHVKNGNVKVLAHVQLKVLELTQKTKQIEI